MKKPVYHAVCIVGNRPQFVKQAMFDQELDRRGTDCRLKSVTVNTGQHYDALLSDVFFKELGAAAPGHELNIGSGPILDQIGKMLGPIREVIQAEKPDVVITFGDTNSTLAAALSAAHLNIPCVHVEGGERLYRRRDVPEEINRVATDHLSDLILTSSRKASRFLRREGMGPDRVAYVGDIMLDLFKNCLAKTDAAATQTCRDYGLQPGNYMLATLHRVENTSSRDVLIGLLEALDGAPMPVLLPMHPRIAHLISSWGWAPSGSLKLIEPLGYFNLLSMLRDCALVVSDSGGLTREALFAGKGCIVPLDSCWWTEAVEAGLAITVGQDVEKLSHALDTFRPDADIAARIVAEEFGDGRSAARIVDAVVDLLDKRQETGLLEGPWHSQGYYSDVPASHDRKAFTYDGFRSMVGELKGAGYSFEGFDVAEDVAGPICLMRHDIDFDLEAALDFARMEADIGVQSTYFLMLTTPHYNLASARAREIMAELRRLGHRIGLHFDPQPYRALVDAESYQDEIGKEAKILETLSGGDMHAVSFHRPTELILEGDPDLSRPWRHSYQSFFKDNFEYVSDSNGRWAHGHPLERDAFATRSPLQILIHPIWWGETPSTAYEKLLQTLDARQSRDVETFARNCRAFRTGHVGRRLTFED